MVLTSAFRVPYEHSGAIFSKSENLRTKHKDMCQRCFQGIGEAFDLEEVVMNG